LRNPANKPLHNANENNLVGGRNNEEITSYKTKSNNIAITY